MLYLFNRYLTFLLICCFCGGIFFFCFYNKTDAQRCEERMLWQKEMQGQRSQAVKQERTGGLSKDLWVSLPSSTRLHYAIHSDASNLWIIEKEGKIEIQEQLMHVQGMMQEYIRDTNQGKEQQITLFSAKEGWYSLNTRSFTANRAEVKFFRLKGDTLPSFQELVFPFLQGTASSIQCKLASSQPLFEALQFKGELAQGKEKIP